MFDVGVGVGLGCLDAQYIFVGHYIDLLVYSNMNDDGY